MRGSLMVFLVLLLVQGCGEIRKKFGRQEGSTEVEFALPGREESALAATLVGDLLIYVVGVSGTNFTTNLKLDDETAPARITLPNGSYKIYAVGWASSGSPNYYPVEGQAYCGFGASGAVVSLTGGSVTVPLTMSTASCNFSQASVFANLGQSGASNFGQFSVNFCTGISGSPACTTNDNSYGGNYLKMVFDIYVRDAGGHRKIGESEFGCAFINTNNAASSKIVPPGGSAPGDPQVFALSFSIHTDSACSSAPIASFSAPYGLDNGGKTGVQASDFNFVSGFSTLYVDL